MSLERREFLKLTAALPAAAPSAALVLKDDGGIDHRFDVAVLRVRPSDVVVIQSPLALSDEAIHHIDQSLRRLFPHNEVAILAEGLTIGVMRKG